MDWVFLIFAICTLAYTGFIFKEYSHESHLLELQLSHLEAERIECERNIQEYEETRQQLMDDIAEFKQLNSEMGKVAAQHLKDLEKLKASMEKQGKFRIG